MFTSAETLHGSPATRSYRLLLCLTGFLLTICLLTGCKRSEQTGIQGYLEGEFVYVASPLGGALESLSVQRGGQVKAGDPLFNLESTVEKAARDEADRRLAQARANLEDAKKGKRPTEIQALEAQLNEAQAALALAEKELARQERLIKVPGATVEQEFDRARAIRDQSRARMAQLEAELNTARLGSRSDQITALEASVLALEAAMTRADWDLAQKRQKAPQAGLVFDTLYREGEWVAPGRPVAVLLPPENIKLRVFVPETQLSKIHHGDRVQVTVDGLTEPVVGKVSFISPQAEFTPPVIYSKESRAKLVFMIEAVFEPATAARLHPGQPVDVQFGL